MVTFIIGLVILFVGAALYSKLCEHVFGPDDRQTPAYYKGDGVADLVEYNYRQPLCYAVTLDASAGTVYAITTVTESTMGYTLDKPLFLGKTEAELSAMTEEDIQTDITTGATVTNVAARDLLVQCFAALVFREGAVDIGGTHSILN